MRTSASSTAKLGNENFVRNAPPDVVAADRARVAELEAQNASLAAQLERVRRMGASDMGKLRRGTAIVAP